MNIDRTIIIDILVIPKATAMFIRILSLSTLICFYFSGFAQEGELSDSLKRNRLTLTFGHAHVPNAFTSNGSKKWLILPTWGLDYDFWINKKWAIGLQSDILIQNFNIEVSEGSKKGKILERKYPITLAAVAIYKPIKSLSVFVGGGQEYSSTEALWLTRIGAEYGWELPKEYEISIEALFDNKWEEYTTWCFGVGASKYF